MANNFLSQANMHHFPMAYNNALIGAGGEFWSLGNKEADVSLIAWRLRSTTAADTQWNSGGNYRVSYGNKYTISHVDHALTTVSLAAGMKEAGQVNFAIAIVFSLTNLGTGGTIVAKRNSTTTDDFTYKIAYNSSGDLIFSNNKSGTAQANVVTMSAALTTGVNYIMYMTKQTGAVLSVGLKAEGQADGNTGWTTGAGLDTSDPVKNDAYNFVLGAEENNVATPSQTLWQAMDGRIGCWCFWAAVSITGLTLRTGVENHFGVADTVPGTTTPSTLGGGTGIQ